MTQEKAIRLLPLTQNETETLILVLSTIILSRIEDKCDDVVTKSLWQGIMPHIKKINEKLNKGVNNGRN